MARTVRRASFSSTTRRPTLTSPYMRSRQRTSRRASTVLFAAMFSLRAPAMDLGCQRMRSIHLLVHAWHGAEACMGS
jgi:hypothetical protein